MYIFLYVTTNLSSIPSTQLCKYILYILYRWSSSHIILRCKTLLLNIKFSLSLHHSSVHQKHYFFFENIQQIWVLNKAIILIFYSLNISTWNISIPQSYRLGFQPSYKIIHLEYVLHTYKILIGQNNKFDNEMNVKNWW